MGVWRMMAETWERIKDTEGKETDGICTMEMMHVCN
jgi:hypothetical protein